MQDLIKRIEAASEGSREMDAQICIAIGLSQDNPIAIQDGWCVGSATNPNPHLSPAYTASIDAAMSLVDGELSGMDFSADETGCWGCVISTHLADGEGFGATPALALCAAALKARQQEQER